MVSDTFHLRLVYIKDLEKLIIKISINDNKSISNINQSIFNQLKLDRNNAKKNAKETEEKLFKNLRIYDINKIHRNNKEFTFSIKLLSEMTDKNKKEYTIKINKIDKTDLFNL